MTHWDWAWMGFAVVAGLLVGIASGVKIACDKLDRIIALLERDRK